MCLYIDAKLHEMKLGRVEYRRATQDILVYKVLDHDEGKSYGISPYMGTKWLFGRQKRSVIERNDYDSTVERGLHSCLNRNSALSHSRAECDEDIFPAVIPKGSLVIYGVDDEVVSNRLIVYRNQAELIKARGAIGPGIARAELATVVKGK